MKLDISLRQTQKLAMTTELRQSIEILQFNSMELIEFLKLQSETNPTFEIEVKEGTDYGSYKTGGAGPVYYNKDDEEEEENQSFDSYISKSDTLYDYIYDQLRTLDINDTKLQIGRLLLGNLDEKGYIDVDLYDFSNEYSFDFQEVEDVLKLLQGFDPPGICSTSLSECLLIQAEKKNYDEITKSIIRTDLIDLAENRVEFLAGKYGLENKDIQEKFDLIKELEPKPGKFLPLNNNPIKFIMPDIILEIENNELVLYINEDLYPTIRRNEYYNDLYQKNIDKDAKVYLNEKFKNANWIIRSIEQRKETIVKVARAIVARQKDFFLHNASLKPLNMKEIADDIEMHESTISRTVNGKYIQTANGIYELKSFFTSSLDSRSGEVSSEEAKLFIKTTIETEDKKKPISDQKIADKLKEKGIIISRRTVQKYRDQLGIPSSTKRKRY